MPPVTYVVPTESTSPRFGEAFARGCGGRIQSDNTLLPGDVALFGSPDRWELLMDAIRAGRTWYYGDHGVLGQRGKMYRITRDAFQPDTAYVRPDYDRWARLNISVQPWRRDGSHILICPNSKRYFELFRLYHDEWLEDVQSQLRDVTDREIRVRWKGDAPIEQDLLDCWAVVVFSSASAIDALVAGVPVFTLAPFASTHAMGHRDLGLIEEPLYPDNRVDFLARLAAQQWTLDEIRAGRAWKVLQAQ